MAEPATLGECLVRIGGLYLLIAILNVVLPGTKTEGYALDSKGKPLQYHLNGLRTIILVVASFAALAHLGLLDPTFFFKNYFQCALAACVIGLVLSTLLYVAGPFKNHVTAPKVLPTREGARKISGLLVVLHDFFFGFELNPRWSMLPMFDFKMYLYLAGAVMVEINVLSGVYAQLEMKNGTLTLPLVIYAAELTWFLLEYLYFENIHLYTYDLFDENVGFKLTWGCLCWYGFFYGAPILLVADPSLQVPTWTLVLSVVVFCLGYPLTRGANLQKFHFKLNPKASFLGIKPEAIDGKLLCSGFWGLSRHINYLGEILLASGIALSAGFNSIFPWLYPLYYVALLFPRERDDDLRCQKKYDRLWTQYCQKVPRRIIPGVY